jgi:hypothetical protein
MTLFNYQPAAIAFFHLYIYEWIDEQDFSLTLPGDDGYFSPYVEAAQQKFLSHGWTGIGSVQLIWIPPFALCGILAGGVGAFMDRMGESWSRGLILWHVKQAEDGLSFLLSPVELAIPDFGLDTD